jgi:hypothetical protein
MPVLYQCPYWKWAEKLNLYCQGGKITFPDRQARLDFLHSYCASPAGWNACPLAQGLTQAYERSVTREKGKQPRQNQAHP